MTQILHYKSFLSLIYIAIIIFGSISEAEGKHLIVGDELYSVVVEKAPVIVGGDDTFEKINYPDTATKN